MAELTVQEVTLLGISPTFSAADSVGDTFKNYGKTIFHVKNGDTADKVVTIASNLCNYGENHDIVVTVPAGGERQIGHFDTQRFNNNSFKVSVSYDAVTSVTVAAIKY
jgi:hypothetical protein